MKKNEQHNLKKIKKKIIGKHIFGNLYGIKDRILTNSEFLTETVKKATEVGNLHIVEISTKKFDGVHELVGGVSVIAILEESHIALHTWPESYYATIDIYSCGKESRPKKAFTYIKNKLKPTKIKMFKADRGN